MPDLEQYICWNKNTFTLLSFFRDMKYHILATFFICFCLLSCSKNEIAKSYKTQNPNEFSMPCVAISRNGQELISSNMNEIFIRNLSGQNILKKKVYPTRRSIEKICIHPNDEKLLVFAINFEAKSTKTPFRIIDLFDIQSGKLVKNYNSIDASYLTTDIRYRKPNQEMPPWTRKIYEQIPDSDILDHLMEFQLPLDRRHKNQLKLRHFNRKNGIIEKRTSGKVDVRNVIGFHPDGKRILVLGEVCEDRFLEFAFILDLQSGKVLKQYQIANCVESTAAFSPCGKFICITGYDNTMIYDVETDERVQFVPIAGDTVCYSPDGTKLFVSTSDFFCIDVKSGKKLWQNLEPPAYGIKKIVFTEDFSKMICAGQFRKIFVLDPNNGRILQKMQLGSSNTSFDYSDTVNTLFIGEVTHVKTIKNFLKP